MNRILYHKRFALCVQILKKEVDKYFGKKDVPENSQYNVDVPVFVIELEMKTRENLMEKVEFSGVNPEKSFIMIERKTKVDGIIFQCVYIIIRNLSTLCMAM